MATSSQHRFSSFRKGCVRWRISLVLVALALATGTVAQAAPPPFPVPTEAARKACSVPGKIESEVAVCLSPQVWASYPAGAVVLGLDDKSRPRGRVFYAMVIGPGLNSLRSNKSGVNDEVFRKEVRRQMAAALGKHAGPIFSGALDQVPTVAFELARRAGENPNLKFSETIASIEASISTNVWGAVQAANNRFNGASLGVYSRYGLDPAAFRLAFYETECVPPSCELPTFALRRDTDRPRVDRYSKLEVWQRLNNLPTNQLTGVFQESTFAGLQHGPLSNVRNVPVVASTPGTRIAAFQRLVAATRAGNKLLQKGFELDSTAPKLLGLTQRSTLALADILQSPVTAIHQLPASGTVELTRVSDELARTRILDCTRLRGVLTSDEVSECSGYKLDMDTWVKCTTNQRCFPTVGSKMLIDAVMVADVTALGAIARNTAFPRIKLAENIEKFQATVDDCVSLPSAESRALCLARKASGSETNTALDCAHKASRLKGREQDALLRTCALNQIPSEQRRQVLCLENFRAQAMDSLLCATQDQMSPEAKALAQCVQATPAKGRSSKSLLDCYLDKKVPGAAKAVACLKKPGTDWRTAVGCALEDQVGGDLGRALKCANEHKANGPATAVCMVKLPGTLGKAAACLAQSNADPLGTLICSAGDSGMTVDQRIAMQCAAQTGGEPASFTTCLVGQMTMKELGYCKGKKFGEGNCFNKNNEFRKVFAAAGVEIGPKSVVADVINVHLRYMEVQLAYASDLVEVAKDVADATKKAIEDGAELMSSATRFVVQTQIDVAKSAATTAIGAAGAVAGAAKGVCKRLFGNKC